MSPQVEQQILTELRLLRTKLFGEDDAETRFGRIPMLESATRDHEKRLNNVERWKIKEATAISVILAIIEIVVHLIPKVH